MTKDDIIRMALEAGFDEHRGNHPVGWGEYPISNEVIERFAALVAAAEREACIQLLEDFSKTQMVPVKDTWRMGLIAGANAIRVRGRA